ncbi:MAG TPA: MBL fold metallo-hydrolase [Acidimicrobiales bacterium]|nr:MBL fold metallo-hydrolase [Acidimicrobiales bacterium]
MLRSFRPTPDVDVVTTTATVPGLGNLALNAFVLHAAEPVLVDAGAVRDAEAFMDALEAVIDPADLRWLWLTHTDFDHIGAVAHLLERNARLRVVTTFLGVGIMSLAAPLPPDRVHLVNPGQHLDVGDRRLRALRPPAFDNPVTTGLLDERAGILFSSDCFGALLEDMPGWAEDVPPEDLHRGQVLWATADSSWLHGVDRTAFARDLERLRALEPSLVLSSHLPPARGSSLDRLLGALAAVPDAPRFVGPDQAALAALLSGAAPSAPAG